MGDDWPRRAWSAIVSNSRFRMAMVFFLSFALMVVFSRERRFWAMMVSLPGTAIPARDMMKSVAFSAPSIKAIVPPSECPMTPTLPMSGIVRMKSMALLASSLKV